MFVPNLRGIKSVGPHANMGGRLTLTKIAGIIKVKLFTSNGVLMDPPGINNRTYTVSS